MITELDFIQNGLRHYTWTVTIQAVMDHHFPSWATPTATDVEWDKIALNYEPECNHKWAVWPFDYNKLCCAYCGAEKPNARN